MRDAISHALNQAVGRLVAVLFALCLTLAGLGFLASAAYLALHSVVPPAGAAALCGLAALGLAMLVLLLARGRHKAPAQAAKSPDTTARAGTPDSGTTPSPDPLALDPLALATRWLPYLRRQGPALAGGAFAAGLVLGISPRARRAAGRALNRWLDGG